ncbi:MAG: tyrosine-type recombinase/integrase [Actinomyces sp.]|jgi:integrase|nr:tyrosine-type recombinase/integrase [Actinomyces sp.]MCI1788436.1 tyrosine-type recombinase/integrase [Actinomyces sp.]
MAKMTNKPRERLPQGISVHNGRYRVRLFVDGVQHSLGVFQTLSDARAALDIARSEKARGTFVSPAEKRRQEREERARREAQVLTVKQWADQWLKLPIQAGKRKGQPVSAGTVRTRRSSLNAHILPVIGDVHLVDVKPAQINAVLAACPTDSARRNAALCLRAMFNVAVATGAGGLETSPFAAVVPEFEPVGLPGRYDMVTPAEVRQLADRMPGNLWLAVTLACWCDLRLGEILGLQRQDFTDLDKQDRAALRVERQWASKASPARYLPPKANSRRTIQIPSAILPEIRDHLARFAADGPEGPVFPSPVDPARPVSQTTVDKAWTRARDGVHPGLRMHDLRAVGLTEYARAGATLRDLMARGGHRDVSVAMKYQRAAAIDDRRVVDSLPIVVRTNNGMIGGEDE